MAQSPDQIRADSIARLERFRLIEAALRADKVRKRTAAFAALALAASNTEGSPDSLAAATSEGARALKGDKAARGVTTGETRPVVAAALIGAGKPARALADARERLPRRGYGWMSGLRPRAVIMIALSNGVAAGLDGRIAAIRKAAPRRWWGARAIGPLDALAFALRGVDAPQAVRRFETVRDALKAGGMGGANAVSHAPRAALFDPDRAAAEANLRSLMQGRKADRRLKLLRDSHRAMLAAAAPDPTALHAALEPPLAHTWERRRKLTSAVASAAAASLGLAALGRAHPDESIRALMAIIATEQAAVIAATSAAAAGAATGATGGA